MKIIENIPGKNPFKVPDNYFEEVNRRIITVTADNKQEIKKAGIYRRFRPFILAAASITGFVILSYTAVRFLAGDRTNPVSDGIFAVTFTEPFINDIDILIIEESAESIEFAGELSGIRKSEIIDYLMLENIETDDIIEQL